MALEMPCTTCGSHDIAKNGMSHRGKQHYQCRDCRRQFVEDPPWQSKPKEAKTLVNRVLQEKISLVGIARATGVAESWRQGHASADYEAVPQTATVIPKPKGPLTV
jgi:insertion element IS1 protein InsB